MKKLIVFVLLVFVATVAMAGCAKAPTLDSTESTTDYYAYQDPYSSELDMWRVVYQEQNVCIWVNTMDDSVWISHKGNSFVPYTIDGKTVYWKGSVEATFQKPVTE